MSQVCFKRCRQYDLSPQFKSLQVNFAFRTIKKVCNVGMSIVKRIFSSFDERNNQIYDWGEVQKIIQSKKTGFYPKSLWQIDCEHAQQQKKVNSVKKLTIFEIKEKLQQKQKVEKPITIKFRQSQLKGLQKSMASFLQKYQRENHVEEISKIKLNVKPLTMQSKYIGVSLFQFYDKKRKEKVINKIVQPKTVFDLNRESFKKQLIQLEEQEDQTLQSNLQIRQTSNNESSSSQQSNLRQTQQKSLDQTKISQNPFKNNKNSEQVKTLAQNKQINDPHYETNSVQTLRPNQKVANTTQNKQSTPHQQHKSLTSEEKQSALNNVTSEKKGKNPFLQNHNPQSLQKIININKSKLFNHGQQSNLNGSKNLFSNPSNSFRTSPIIEPTSHMAAPNVSTNQNMFSLIGNSQNNQQKQNPYLSKKPEHGNTSTNDVKSNGLNFPMNMFLQTVNKNNPAYSHNSSINNSFLNRPNYNHMPTQQNNQQNSFQSIGSMFSFSDKQNPKNRQILDSMVKPTDRSISNESSIFGDKNDSFSKKTSDKRRYRRDKSDRI